MYNFKANPQQYCLILNDDNTKKIYDLEKKEFCKFDNQNVQQNVTSLLKLLNVTEYKSLNEIYAKNRKSDFIKSTLVKVSRLWAS